MRVPYQLILAPGRWCHQPGIVYQDIQAILLGEKIVDRILNSGKICQIEEQCTKLPFAGSRTVFDIFDSTVDLLLGTGSDVNSSTLAIEEFGKLISYA